MAKYDEPKLRQIKKRTEDNSLIIEKIVDQLVGKYNKDLDMFIGQVKVWLDKRDRLEDHEVENMTIRIPVFMYFASNGVENLGIQCDTAKAVKMEAYNDAVMVIDGTICDKKSHAENETINEYLVEAAFMRAYKKLRTKLEMCEQLCQASRKVLQMRISNLDINRVDKSSTGSTGHDYKMRERV